MTGISKWTLVVVAVGALVLPTSAEQRDTPARLLEAARQKLTLEGDARAAITIYRDIVTRFARTDRSAAATALLGMADCYEKLGDPQATDILKRVVAEYADQAQTAAAARERLASGLPRPICDTCGDPLGSVSKDGRTMATVQPYIGGGDRAGDVGVMDLSTSRLTPLQIEGSGKGAESVALFPVLSPDGRLVAYSQSAADGVEVRVAPSQPGGRGRTLYRPEGGRLAMPVDWGATGILGLEQEPDGTIQLIVMSPTDGLRRVLKPLGFSVTPGPHTASFSPDGRFVAYERFASERTQPTNERQGASLDRQIHLLATDGTSDVPITTGAGVKRWATWTPNGSHVLYVSNVAGTWDLWATPVQNGRPAGDPVLVKKSLGADVMGLGTSSSGLFFFYEGRAGVFKSSIAPVVTGGGTSTATDTFVGARPVWSPDGARVAINRPRPDGVDGVDLIVRTLASGDERVVRRNGLVDFPAMWFPDGTAVLVQVREAPNTVYWYRVDTATLEFTRLVRQRANTSYWTHQNVRTLSADGRTLFFGTYANQTDPQLDRITALDLPTGEYRDVFRLPATKEHQPRAAQDLVLAASPDGRSLAVMYRDPTDEVAHLGVVGVDGQGYRELLPAVQANYLRNKLVWSRDGRHVYFTTTIEGADDDRRRIMRVPATGGTAESVGLVIDGLETFDLSPDGRRIVYSTLRPEGWSQLLWSLDVSWLARASR